MVKVNNNINDEDTINIMIILSSILKMVVNLQNKLLSLIFIYLIIFFAVNV